MTEKIIIKLIDYGSEEYLKELELRNKILRKPLGLSIFDNNLKAEAEDYHIGAFVDDTLIGVLILTKISSEEIKMRQVAVDDQLQNKKIGSGMVNFSEEFARRHNYRKIVLKARKTAIGFYEKLGYFTEGEEFIEVTIPHMSMYKYL